MHRVGCFRSCRHRAPEGNGIEFERINDPLPEIGPDELAPCGALRRNTPSGGRRVILERLCRMATFPSTSRTLLLTEARRLQYIPGVVGRLDSELRKRSTLFERARQDWRRLIGMVRRFLFVARRAEDSHGDGASDRSDEADDGKPFQARS